MATPNQLSAAELQELAKLYKQVLGYSDQIATAEASRAQSMGNARQQLELMRKELESMTKDITEQVEAFRDLAKEISGQRDGIKETVKGFKNLNSISEKIQYHQKGISVLSTKEIENLQKKLAIERQRFEETDKQLKKEKTELELKQARTQLLINTLRAKAVYTEEDLKKELKLNKIQESINAELQKNVKSQQEIAGIISEQDANYLAVKATLEKIRKENKQIEKSMGLTGALMKGMSKIPFLGDLPGMSGVLGEVEEDIRRIQTETGKSVSRTEAMGRAFKKMGPIIKGGLTDPLAIIGLLVKGFKMFLELGFAVDKQITEMGKSMAVTKNEAALTRDRFVDIQNSSGNLLDTTKNLVEAQGQLSKAFGVTRGFTDAQLKDQIMLTKQVGLEEESAAGLQQLALANGKSANDILKSTIRQTAALARQTGVQLDNKKVLADVAKVSGQLRLQYQNNPELIAKAVVQTQKLGISLEQAKDIANKLLDFESSINSELEAELLTGKQINLEEARLLALQGKSAEAAALIAEQVGSAAEFSNLNVIAQQSLAEAVGMSADELANSLVYQENLTRLGSETRKQVEKEIELAKQQGDMEKVRMLERSVGNEENALAALQEISAQEKFNAAVDKLKSMLSDIVSGPASKFVDMLGKLASNASLIKGVFYTIVGLASAIAASMIIAAAVTNPIGFTVGLLAAAGGLALLNSAMSTPTPIEKKGDVMYDPNGGLIVSSPQEGALFQLSKKDGMMAGPVTNTGGGGENNSAIEEQNTLLRELVNKPVKVDVGNFFNDSARSAVRVQ